MYRNIAGIVTILSCIVASPSNAAPDETVLYKFPGTEVSRLQGKLLRDAQGDLYGTASEGGTNNVGVVFRLRPPTSLTKRWTAKVIYQFGQSSNDGANPTSGVISDAAGNLYGTTAYGGFNYGGTVFELSPPADGAKSWSETQLYSFQGYRDGCEPIGGLIADAVGNLYGTTQGCKFGVGTVFELVRPPAGEQNWKEVVLHDFVDKNDGTLPASTLMFDQNGNLFGVANGGGSGSDGIVFELSPPGPGGTSWSETIVHRFVRAAAGQGPSGGLVMDASHALYGTTALGGSAGYGVVYKLVPPSGQRAHWSELVLYNFTGGADGGIPVGTLIFDKTGNLYGLTINNFGNVFELLTPAAHKNKPWSESVLHSFTNDANGSGPAGDLLADQAGTLFGVTNSPATVYQVAP